MRTGASVILLLALTEPAFACHHFSRWFYPWPQHCSLSNGRNFFAPAQIILRHATASRVKPTPAPALVVDRSWYVEIPATPPAAKDPDADRRKAIEMLKLELQREERQ